MVHPCSQEVVDPGYRKNKKKALSRNILCITEEWDTDWNSYDSDALWSQSLISCVNGTNRLPPTLGGRNFLIQSSFLSGYSWVYMCVCVCMCVCVSVCMFVLKLSADCWQTIYIITMLTYYMHDYNTNFLKRALHIHTHTHLHTHIQSPICVLEGCVQECLKLLRRALNLFEEPCILQKALCALKRSLLSLKRAQHVS